MNTYSQLLESQAAYVERCLSVAIEDNPKALWNSATLRIEAELGRAAVRDAHFLKSWPVAIKEEIFYTAQNRLLDELCEWIDGTKECDCGGRSFAYWVNRALNTARKTYVNRAKRRVHADIETTERCTFRIARRPSSDDQGDAPTPFDRKTTEWLRPIRRGRPEPRSFLTHWYLGDAPPAGFKPRTSVEAEKMRIADLPDDVRTTGGRG